MVKGSQNMPFQYMPLWHVHCFELKILEKQEIQEDDLSEFLLSA